MDKMKAVGDVNGLSGEFIEKIFKAVHQESISRQKDVMNMKPTE